MRRATHFSFLQLVMIVGVIFSTLNSDAQRTITGFVRDSSRQALPSAGVNLIDGKGAIIGFAFTNKSGAFSLLLPSESLGTAIWVEASHVGYSKQRLMLLAGQKEYQFYLVPNEGLLKEVIVERKAPIEKLGDTMRFDVDRFAQKEDRSIGDVLRRMPGVEVSSDGTISFNGKKVSNLYIHGDDLMSGRYGIATKTINKESIVSVDVIRNHQPIKVLKNKINSDNTSINLILRNPESLKLSGSSMIGAGFPKLYNISATAILLNERIKAINNIAFNNNGVNYSDNFKQLGSSNLSSRIDNKQTEFSLSQATVSPPDVPLPNYYFNHSGVINLNELYKTKKEVQIKLNVQAFKDRNNIDYFSRTDNYLQNDTITYLERQAITNHPTLFNTTLNLTMNKSRYFFNNSLRFEIGEEQNKSRLDFNQYAFQQSLRKRVNAFSNDINWIFPLTTKSVGEVRWLVSYHHNDQALKIGEGYQFQALNQQSDYSNVFQNVQIPRFFSNAYLGYKKPGNIVAQQYTAGLIFEDEGLNSQLLFEKNNSLSPYHGDKGNNLNWFRKSVYVSPEYQIKYKSFKSNIALPVSFQDISYGQKEYNFYSKTGSVLFNPAVQASYDFDPQHFLNTSYSFTRDFSDISGIFKGGILKNYRIFIANDAGLQQKADHLFSTSYKFQNAARMVFANVGVNFNKTIARAILSTVLLSDLQTTVVLPYENKQTRLSASGGFSKYFFKLKSTGSLKSEWSRYRYVQIINDQLQPFFSDVVLINAKLMKKILQAASFVYEPTGFWNTSGSIQSKRDPAPRSNRTFRLDQHLSVILMPVKSLNIELAGRHSLNKQSNSAYVQYFFTDLKATYTMRNRIDVNISVTNLWNVSNYTSYSVTPYQFNINEYTLRGRMSMLQVNWFF